MIGILRAWAVGLVVLTVFYWLLKIYFRSTRRERLEEEFDAQAMQGDRDAWVEAQMKDYGRSLKLKLVWLVYILPMIGIGLAIYFVNYD